MIRKRVAIESIWLRYVGGENDPHARVVVEVNRGGRWFEVINEAHGSAFSHCVSAEGILTAEEPDRETETARRRSQGARSGWEIRRAKAETKKELGA